MLIDARSVADGAELAGDLCVIGAGPAGISIVERLRQAGLKVFLVEAGGLEPTVSAQALYKGANVGRRYLPLDTCRFRLFGGSTNRWGGWSRPLEPLDLEQRDWVPWSGWPITVDMIEPYYEFAAELLQLSSARFDLPYWADRLPAPFPLGDGDFGNTLIQYSPQTNFGEVYRAGIVGSRNVTCLLNGSVTELRLEPAADRVRSARVVTGGGRAFSIHARAFVLASGGIENPRLLLASRADRPAGLGNENDLVGRFFMEHLHVPAGHLLASAAASDRSFYDKGTYGGARVRGFIAPTTGAQRRHRLLACFIGIEPPSYAFGTAYLGWPPELKFGPVRLYRRLRRSRVAPVAEWAKTRAERMYFLRRRAETWSAAKEALARVDGEASDSGIYSLYFRTEQAPNPASRVSLGENRDRFGVPQVQLDWRVSPVDTASIVGWLRRLDAAVASAGLGRLIMPRQGWEDGIIGGPHHIGTTRMAANPAQGVVDEHCRVHSLDNLYIAGSSVFATSGYANPTFTIVALALRLADRLQSRLAQRERAPVITARRPGASVA